MIPGPDAGGGLLPVGESYRATTIGCRAPQYTTGSSAEGTPCDCHDLGPQMRLFRACFDCGMRDCQVLSATSEWEWIRRGTSRRGDPRRPGPPRDQGKHSDSGRLPTQTSERSFELFGCARLGEHGSAGRAHNRDEVLAVRQVFPRWRSSTLPHDSPQSASLIAWAGIAPASSSRCP